MKAHFAHLAAAARPGAVDSGLDGDGFEHASYTRLWRDKIGVAPSEDLHWC
jgi:hypothetical protein